MIYDIKNFGAVADGKTLNTKAIQAAIDACTEAGGGRVLVSGGIFMTGTVILKENVDLHIAADGVLLASSNIEDFPERQDVRHVETEMLPRYRNACIIFADECNNICITGMGKIDCNGLSFVKLKDEYKGGWRYERIDAPTPPRAVFLTGCTNVRIENITMINQPSGWSYWIHDCDYVTCDKLKIIADVHYPNNDGIHINSSRNVTVSNCMITSGDDCIVVRANNASLAENKVCERVTVTNCSLTSYACGIRIGWLHDGVIRNCTFSNIVMTDTNTGISLQLPWYYPREKVADQGREATLIENLSFSNIVMDSIYASPIRFFISPDTRVRCEAIRNIYFSGVRSRGLEFPWIVGRPEDTIKNITFSDCSFEKVSDEVLPAYRDHGAAAWDRPLNNTMFKHTENVVFNNTSFTVK